MADETSAALRQSAPRHDTHTPCCSIPSEHVWADPIRCLRDMETWPCATMIRGGPTMNRVPNPDEARRLARLRFDRPPRPDLGLDRTVLLRALQTLHGDNVPLYSRGIITTPEEYADKIMECANAEFAGQPIGNDVEQTMRDDAAAPPEPRTGTNAARISQLQDALAAPEGLDVERLAILLREYYGHGWRSRDDDRPHEAFLKDAKQIVARLSESGSPSPWRDDSDACPTCAHRPHDPGKCKARYRVTLAEDEEGDSCLCESGSPTPLLSPCSVVCCDQQAITHTHRGSAPTPPGEEED